MDSEVSNASTPDSDSNCAGYFARALFARLQMVTYHEGHGTCPRMKESDHELSNIHLSCPVSLECPLLALFCSSWKAAHAGPLFPAFLWEYHPVHPAGASQSYCFMNLQIMPWMGGWRLEVPYLQNKKCIYLLWMLWPMDAYTDKRNTRTAESVSAKASTKPQKAHPLLPRGIWSPGFKSRAGLFGQVYSLRL